MAHDNLETLFLARARIDAAALARWASVDLGELDEAAEEIGVESPFTYDDAARLVDLLEEDEEDGDEDEEDGEED